MTRCYWTLFSSVPLSNALVLESWRAFWADLTPFKGPRPQPVRCFRNYRDTRTPSRTTDTNPFPTLLLNSDEKNQKRHWNFLAAEYHSQLRLPSGHMRSNPGYNSHHPFQPCRRFMRPGIQGLQQQPLSNPISHHCSCWNSSTRHCRGHRFGH